MILIKLLVFITKISYYLLSSLLILVSSIAFYIGFKGVLVSNNKIKELS